MATLQKIRSKGPLLIIVIGLALFAFIAGDAWRVFQPHQVQDVGEVNGESLSAPEYQQMIEEYTEIIKLTSGMSALPEQQMNQVKDEVWSSFVNNKLIEAEAEKLGLVVTVEEVQSIIEEGTHPMLQQTPFRNPQTGAFDHDMLKKFLVDYSKMKSSPQIDPQMAEYYEGLNKYWTFIEKNLIQNRLAEKYQALIGESLLSNPVEAIYAFDSKNKESNLLMAAIPYSSIPDSLVKVEGSEIKSLYNQRKEQYKQYNEARNIRYIDVEVIPSDADKETLKKEVEELTSQLNQADMDYSAFIRSTGSDVLYEDLYFPKEAFPSDVIARLDSVNVGSVFGPYFSPVDNSYTSFKVLSKVNKADSTQFRQIQVFAESEVQTKELADSIFNAVKAGADFSELARMYGQDGSANWISSANYANAQLDQDNFKFISAISNGNKGEVVNLKIGQANIILQITDKKAVKEQYKIPVIKKEIEFSKETYSDAYNAFSQFVAANTTLEEMVANAEEAGYRLLEKNDLTTAEHNIGGIVDTKEAIRWAFSAKPGDVSGLYECGNGDRLLVVALVDVIKEGYRPVNLVQSELRAELVRDKKAELILDKMKGANSFADYTALTNVVTDTIKHVSFAAPAYVSSLYSSEPLVGAYASIAKENEVSNPIKGNGGVFVLQALSVDKLDQEFDEENEKENLKTMNTRLASRFMSDLYLNAKVKDNRYLFF